MLMMLAQRHFLTPIILGNIFCYLLDNRLIPLDTVQYNEMNLGTKKNNRICHTLLYNNSVYVLKNIP